MARSDATFPTIRSEGGLLPGDLLGRIAAGDPALPGFDPETFGLQRHDRVTEAIASAWEAAKGLWSAFGAAQQRLRDADSGVTETRNLWVLPLLELLGYDNVQFRNAAETIDGRPFRISHRAGGDPQAPPVHIVSYKETLDTPQLTGEGTGPRRASPHSLMQDYLNRTDHLWGIVTNGRTLRVLRDNRRLSRAAYLEIDLDAMLAGSVYADFVLLYLLLHRSRLPQPGQQPEDCLLEQWMEESEAQGTRALDELRRGVETAIEALGKGLVEHPDNEALRAALTSGTLSLEDYYRQLLRLVYRFLFLLAAEDRDLLFDPAATLAARRRYLDWYGIGRLRELVARRRHADRHDDLWRSLQVTFRALRDETEAERLGLEPLGGGLFDVAACAAIETSQIDNVRLLTAIRGLTFTEQTGRLQRINYRDMGVEELGSVYEGLLELQPRLSVTAAHPVFELGASGERKSTGSYYTNSGLVQELIRSALDPVIAERLAAAPTAQERTAALLALNVCDPACGSGHFLLAAARRIGRELAVQASGDDEPDAAATRHGVRQAIQHCVYGVDLNPLAVDLCKVALWLEAHEPGKPIGFLDHHIRQGNALVGATEALMRQGIPSDAFKDVTGDDKKYAAGVRKTNTQELRGQLGLQLHVTVLESMEDHRAYFERLESDDDSVAQVQAKERDFQRYRESPAFARKLLRADLWTAAFFWPLQINAPAPPTQSYWTRLCDHRDLADLLDEGSAAAQRHRAEARTVQLAHRLADDNHVFHWELEFEDVFAGDDPGFDVILGNPPWERVKLQEQEFFASRDTEIASARNAAERKRKIEALRTSPDAQHRALFDAYLDELRRAENESKFLRTSGRFPLTGRGDVNTYQVFAELSWTLAHDLGMVGLIVPDGIALNASTAPFFNKLIDQRTLKSLFGFKNERFLFKGVEHRLTFCLLTIGGNKRRFDLAEFCWMAWSLQEMQDPLRRVWISADDIALFNPNTRTCPIFRTERDAEITKAIYRAAPVLVREGPPEVNPWGLTFKTMFHMSNDSHLFRTREELSRDGFTLDPDGRFRRDGQTWLPLYEAKLIHQYDHRFATFEDSAKEEMSRVVTLAEHQDPKFVIMPRYWVSNKEVERIVGTSWADHQGWFMGFRDITNATNERTGIFSLLPWSAVGHTFPLFFTDQSPSLATCLLANLNSFVFDYVVKQKLGGTHLTYFILKQLPIIPPERFSEPILRLIQSAADELIVTSQDISVFSQTYSKTPIIHSWETANRQTLRATLDAVFAHLYGVSSLDFSYILDCFNVTRDIDTRETGEYITKRLCLAAFEELSWIRGLSAEIVNANA